jgi:hypothetical protein
MTERVAIFNAAAGHIGVGDTVANVDTDQSPLAKACRRQYALCRDTLLAEHPWLFARRCETLAAWTTPPPDAAYAYRFDPSFLVVRLVLPYLHAPPMPWRLGGVTDPVQGDVTLLLTDTPATLAVATRRIEREQIFRPLFVEALGWRLAWGICKELSKDEATRQECWVQYLYWTNLAKAQDQMQATYDMPDGELYEAREGATFGLTAVEQVEYRRLHSVA